MSVQRGDNSCVFCNIANGTDNSNTIRMERELVVLFDDKYPKSSYHYQCISKKHIRNISHLTKLDLPLLEEMKSCAVEFLLENHKSDISHFRLGFHRPPFNSVSHLHLHVIGPLRYSVHEIMFNPRMGIFVPVDDLLESLRRKASEASSQ
ncbi:hypothetical protein CRM22_006530 [Opisthorchis felineus]|uniref:HIT domain-containing protein n=1 Tax=Opisthorchis felineus TaxID=147828 RepID=A0A4S2LKG1_OPIFE|nr:hypothetical protein CRM22_006530 [Opisthorchis felineus]